MIDSEIIDNLHLRPLEVQGVGLFRFPFIKELELYPLYQHLHDIKYTEDPNSQSQQVLENYTQYEDKYRALFNEISINKAYSDQDYDDLTIIFCVITWYRSTLSIINDEEMEDLFPKSKSKEDKKQSSNPIQRFYLYTIMEKAIYKYGFESLHKFNLNILLFLLRIAETRHASEFLDHIQSFTYGYAQAKGINIEKSLEKIKQRSYGFFSDNKIRESENNILHSKTTINDIKTELEENDSYYNTLDEWAKKNYILKVKKEREKDNGEFPETESDRDVKK